MGRVKRMTYRDRFRSRSGVVNLVRVGGRACYDKGDFSNETPALLLCLILDKECSSFIDRVSQILAFIFLKTWVQFQ